MKISPKLLAAIQEMHASLEEAEPAELADVLAPWNDDVAPWRGYVLPGVISAWDELSDDAKATAYLGAISDLDDDLLAGIDPDEV